MNAMWNTYILPLRFTQDNNHRVVTVYMRQKVHTYKYNCLEHNVPKYIKHNKPRVNIPGKLCQNSQYHAQITYRRACTFSKGFLTNCLQNIGCQNSFENLRHNFLVSHCQNQYKMAHCQNSESNAESHCDEQGGDTRLRLLRQACRQHNRDLKLQRRILHAMDTTGHHKNTGCLICFIQYEECDVYATQSEICLHQIEKHKLAALPLSFVCRLFSHKNNNINLPQARKGMHTKILENSSNIVDTVGLLC